MDTPLFLSMGQIVLLHGSLIQHYGGIDGTRDSGLLQSTIAMPLESYGGDYLHAYFLPALHTQGSSKVQDTSLYRAGPLADPACYSGAKTSRNPALLYDMFPLWENRLLHRR